MNSKRPSSVDELVDLQLVNSMCVDSLHISIDICGTVLHNFSAALVQQHSVNSMLYFQIKTQHNAHSEHKKTYFPKET